MNTSIQALFFDLDGTIIDSEAAGVQAIRDCLSTWGLELQREHEHFVPGRTWPKIIHFLRARYDIEKSEAEIKDLIFARYRELLTLELPEVPGAVQAVDTLAERYPLALVSGSSRNQIAWALEKLGILDRFTAVFGLEDYPQSKPQPDGYLAALKHLNVDAKRCIVFEDSEAGLQSGRSAGLWVVGVTSTNHFEQSLSNAHVLIRDFSDVTPTWLETQMERLARTGK